MEQLIPEKMTQPMIGDPAPFFLKFLNLLGTAVNINASPYHLPALYKGQYRRYLEDITL